MAFKPIQIEGMENTVRRLRKVPAVFAEDQVKPILLEGAETFRDSARANAPVDTGALKSSLTAKLSTRQGAIAAFMAVDMAKISKINRKTGKKVRYPYFVERAVRYFRRAVRSKTSQVKARIERRLADLMRNL